MPELANAARARQSREIVDPKTNKLAANWIKELFEKAPQCLR